MKHSIFLSFLICVSAAGAFAQPLDKSDLLFIDSTMNDWYKAGEPGAVLLIAKKGQPIFRKGYGLASVELQVTNQPTAVFRIGSMSKQFTAAAVLMLAQEGKLDLKDDLKKYLPEYNTHGRHISIENVLTHTSGIIDAQNKPDFVTRMRTQQSPADLLHSFMDDSLLFEPGTDWHYSNSNYELAGFVVEKVSGMPLREFLQARIFTPLHMDHTYIDNEDSVFSGLVRGYDKIAGKFRPAFFLSYSWEYSAGDILSNVDDLLKWNNALLGGNVLKKEWLQKAWTPFILAGGQSTHYGFGWTNNSMNGMEIIEHSGRVNGFSSDGIILPVGELYMCILSNNTAVWSAAVASQLLVYLGRQKDAAALKNNTVNKNLTDFMGVYRLQRPGGNATIDSTNGLLHAFFIVQNDTLFAKPPTDSKFALSEVGRDLFVASYGNPYYQFRRNKSGNVISVERFNQPIQLGPAEVRMKTALPLPKAKKAVILTAEQLAPFKGKYDFGGGAVAPVTIEGSSIFIQLQEKFEILAEDETHFFFTTGDGSVEFIKEAGKVTGVKVTQGAVYFGRKIE